MNNPGTWIESAYKVPANASYFEGHFPGHPLVPGAVLLGWMLDAVLENARVSAQSLRASNVKFLAEVHPESEVTIGCRKISDAWEARIMLDNRIAAKARILLD